MTSLEQTQSETAELFSGNVVAAKHSCGSFYRLPSNTVLTWQTPWPSTASLLAHGPNAPWAA